MIAQIFGLLLLANVGLETWHQYELSRQTYRENKQAAEREAKDAADQIADKCQVFAQLSPAFRECLRNEIGAYQKQDTTNKDLQAQQDMAFWAFCTFAVGAASIAVGIGGLIALFMSLRQTRQAISLDREIGHAEVRAYLGIDFADQEINLSREKHPSISFNVTNRGTSPARKVRYVAGLVVKEFPLPDDQPRIFAPKTGQSVPTFTVQTGSPIIGTAESIEEFDFKTLSGLLSSPDRRLYVTGTIVYEDVFREERYTDFCFYAVTGVPIKTGLLAIGSLSSTWIAAHVLNDAT